MINKSMLNKILKLEEQYSIININIEEYANNVIEVIETILEYEIKSRIKIKDKYSKIDSLENDIFSFLTVEELRRIAYYSRDEKRKVIYLFL